MVRKFPLLLVGLIVLAACGGGEKEEARQMPSERVESAYPADAPTAALTVQVSMSGVVPQGTRIRMNADPQCAAMHKEEVLFRPILIDAAGRLQNVFVYVKEGLPRRPYPVPQEAVVLDQKGCMYEPRVLGVRVHQKIVIQNSDPTLHNVNATPRQNRPFNFAQPMQGMKTERTFAQPEVMIPLKCDVHPWMSSFIGVMDHPFFGVTGAEGNVQLNDLPPGQYVISAWHEQLGTLDQRISLEPGESKTLEFRFERAT